MSNLKKNGVLHLLSLTQLIAMIFFSGLLFSPSASADPFSEIIKQLQELNVNLAELRQDISQLNQNGNRFFPIAQDVAKALLDGASHLDGVETGISDTGDFFGFVYENRVAVISACAAAAGMCCIVSACRIDKGNSLLWTGCSRLAHAVRDGVRSCLRLEADPLHQADSSAGDELSKPLLADAEEV